MDLQSFFIFNKSFNILIIIFSTLMFEPLSVDSRFTTCIPQNCGNGPNISYPFWIPLQQESYCGSPGFNITCHDNNPVLTVSDDDYIVRDIFYANNSFLLANADVYDEDNTCPTPLHNFSIEGTPFSYGPAYADLYFFYNCTYLNKYATYSVDCVSNAPGYSFAVFHVKPLKEWNYSVESCQGPVNAPVDADSLARLLKMNFTDILKKGFVLEWSGYNCSNCESSGGRCGSFNNEFICFCNDQPHLRTCNTDDGLNLGLKIGIGDGLNLGLKLGIGFGAASIVLLPFSICAIIYCIRKYSKTTSLPFWKRETENSKKVEAFIKQYGSSTPRRYKYSDIKKITNSFKHELGQGGYGSVYKGRLADGRLVAVKVLNTSKGNGEDFINEVASMGRTSHVNVVTLLEFCYEHKRRALIYEFMSNGSLEKFIYHKIPPTTDQHLGGEKLYEIALGIARGLEYLHRWCNTRILHFDIKPHNILLDENFCPKISDFGLAKLYPKKESIVSMLEARGTIGYIAPEVFSRNFGGVSHKSDVYSYGMMVLEMVGGRKNIDAAVCHTSEIYFPHWIYNQLELDQDLQLQGLITIEENEIAKKMLLVGLWCIQTDPSQRPSMNKVIGMLEGSMEALKIPPKPFLYSPRSPHHSSTTTTLPI